MKKSQAIMMNLYTSIQNHSVLYSKKIPRKDRDTSYSPDHLCSSYCSCPQDAKKNCKYPRINASDEHRPDSQGIHQAHPSTSYSFPFHLYLSLLAAPSFSIFIPSSHASFPSNAFLNHHNNLPFNRIPPAQFAFQDNTSYYH